MWIYRPWKTWRKIALWSVVFPGLLLLGWIQPSFQEVLREGKSICGCVWIAQLENKEKTWFCPTGFCKEWELLQFVVSFEILCGVTGRWVRDLSAGTWWQITSIKYYHKALQSTLKLQAPEIWIIFLYLWIYLYMHEKILQLSLIITKNSAKIFWQWLWAKPTENLLIKGCHGLMVRSP